ESNMDIRQEVSLKKGEDLLSPLADRVKEWTDGGVRAYLTAHNRAQAERTRDLLSGYGLDPSVIKSAEILEGALSGFSIVIGSLSSGFRLPGSAIAIVSEEEVFGERVKRRAPPSRKLEAFVAQLQDLSPGDFIVHSMHGVGLYRGLKRLDIDGVENEFLLLEYRGGDKLYLPVLRMDLVSKYHGVEGGAPELDRLGGAGWEKKKNRVKQAVEKLAGELLKLYAEREVAEGFAFSAPDRTFHEFEAGFEYEETPDQGRAIEECLKDMEEPRPMDRLICGDVGYGKTEVAIRAAFKAVLDKKQVAVLVPTTVLAQQHFRTFCKRLAPYPVTVEVLSRFRSKKEQKDVVDRLARGLVDIIIGTHRLLQKDVGFKDLGLIVIDEEHRFGVAHKERFKQMRKRVDVLTLTATPIPRTLHMSLASIRELSIINTPPEDRLSVKTSVIRFDEAVIAEAIERELHRGGQVFFVHNRIESMGKMEEVLRRICPHARVAVAHGQMREGELEEKMLGFVNWEYDVLLSTAIVESGLDIPSANTIIINRADRFGLADLYQLRGRVGRSRHRAYAYFICPLMSELTDDARKRIEVIQELCEPGSGFKVATYDLEIRGAGELLGSAQSGQIAEVGF
ncbi:MAG: transcription-repair coupling factor, partial [Deltaproteobacteria bacterium]